MLKVFFHKNVVLFLYDLTIWSHVVSSSKQVELKTDLYLLFIISDSHGVVGGGYSANKTTITSYVLIINHT